MDHAKHGKGAPEPDREPEGDAPESPAAPEDTAGASAESPPAAPAPAPASPPVQAAKPHVTFSAGNVEMHLVPGGRAIFMTGKTKVLKLARNSDAGLDDENVRTVLAMAAGADMRDAISAFLETGDTTALKTAYAKATGNT